MSVRTSASTIGEAVVALVSGMFSAIVKPSDPMVVKRIIALVGLRNPEKSTAWLITLVIISVGVDGDSDMLSDRERLEEPIVDSANVDASDNVSELNSDDACSDTGSAISTRASPLVQQRLVAMSERTVDFFIMVVEVFRLVICNEK